MGLVERLRATFAGGRQAVSEIIGRVGYGQRRVQYSRSDDRTQVDYAWWDKLWRGKQPSYKLGSLFVKPIIHHITSWMLGDGFKVNTISEMTNEALADFVNKNLKLITGWVKGSMRLGDAYLVVNADGTLSAVPPNQVKIQTDELDYRNVLSYTITTVLEKATITDEYRLDGRTVIIKRPNMADERIDYANLTGRLAVIPLHHGRSENEVYGHPLAESLVPLFAEYDDVLTNSLTGVKEMGNPVPTLEKVDDPGAELEALSSGSETYIDADGNQQTTPIIDWDGISVVATSGEFNHKAPAPFTADAWQMLKALFYLMLQHTNIPEWVWGGAIASSKASVDAQMPAWVKFIDGQRQTIEDGLLNLVLTWCATVALYTPGVVVDEDAEIEWAPVAPKDKAMHLNYVKHAGDRSLITGETELELLNLVKDAAAEYAAAQAEVAEAAKQEDRYGSAWERALDDVEFDDAA